MSKNLLDEVKEIQGNIIENDDLDLEPIDDRKSQELADDNFIEIDNRTRRQLQDDDYFELESPPPSAADNEVPLEDYITGDASEEEELEEIETTPSHVQWNPKKTKVSEHRKPRIKISSNYNQKVRAVNKIKKKYQRKRIGDLGRTSNKISKEWLKTAGYLDTKDQNAINLYVCPTEKCTKK